MKKNMMFAAVIMTLIMAPFSIGFAQELTRANSAVLLPSLTQAVSYLSGIIQSEITRRHNEQASLAGLSPVLNNAARQISLSGANLTQTQINSLSVQLSSVQKAVSTVTQRRLSFQNNLKPVVNTLNDIVTTLASVRS